MSQGPQAEAEMRDAATRTGNGRIFDEPQNVTPARRLGVDEAIAASVLAETKDRLQIRVDVVALAPGPPGGS
jgi:hypothetical protein